MGVVRLRERLARIPWSLGHLRGSSGTSEIFQKDTVKSTDTRDGEACLWWEAHGKSKP